MPITATEKSIIDSHLQREDCTLDELIQCLVHLRSQHASAPPNSVSPLVTINNVPEKVLVEISQISVASRTQSPLALSHVSQKWRQVALSTPSLWTYINTKEGPPYERTSEYLRRSAPSAPAFDIDFTSDTHPFDVAERNLCSQILVAHLQRCQSFNMSSIAMEPFQLLLPHLIPLPAPYLKQFEIFYFGDEEQDIDDEDWIAFGGQAPNLRSMTISGLHVPWKTFNIVGLQAFAFDFHSADVLRSLRGFHGVLTASWQTLRVLTIMQAGDDKLSLDSDWVAKSDGDGDGDPASNRFKRVDLPGLEELVFSFVSAELACDLLRLLAPPSLQALTLEYIKHDPSPLLDIVVDAFPNITRLRLIRLPAIAPGRLLHFLRNGCANVTSLHVDAFRSKGLEEIPFLMRWMALERQEYLIPRLAEISCAGMSPRRLRELIQSRPDGQRPQKVVLRVKERLHPEDDVVRWLQTNVPMVQFEEDSGEEDDGIDY